MVRRTIDILTGGMNTGDPTSLKNNEFELIEDMYYDADARLRSRYGYKTFGNKIGDKGINTLIFFKNDTSNTRYIFAFAGTSFYELDFSNNNWIERKDGLSEFEADGETKVRWGHAVYLNKLYMGNGVDLSAEYDPATQTWTDLIGQPKCRYFRYLGDSIYSAGDDAKPNWLYATDAAQVDAKNLNANSVAVGSDEYGRINAIEEQQKLIIVLKDRKIYSVQGDLSRVDAIDSESGGFGNRTISMIGSGLVYMGPRGMDRLITRNGTSGDLSLTTAGISDNVLSYFDDISDKTKREAVGMFVPKLHHYYFSFSEGNLGDNTTTLVYNSKQKAWTKYNLPTWNDACTYIDEQGFEHILIASNQKGQVYEIEVGNLDGDDSIFSKFTHKSMDFNEPGLLKRGEYIDLVGLKRNDDLLVNVSIEDDTGEEIAVGEISKEELKETIVFGENALGLEPIGGGGEKGAMELQRFVVRIPIMTYFYFYKIKMESESMFSIEKITTDIEKESTELFDFSNII